MISDYLKMRSRIIIIFIAVILIFSSSYLLFDMPVITVLYPLILSIVILLIVGIVDYRVTVIRHRKFKQEGTMISLDPAETSSIIERDYREIIEMLKGEERFHSQKAASDYNNMVEYYTVWAHQIKTPIASMRLALQSEDTDVARRLGGDLNRIEEYVEMVLTFLRLDSDSTDYVIRECELDDIIRSAIRKFSRDFISKKLKMEYEPIKRKTLTDEKWLSFVIEQVISNAVKYTFTGGIKIYMETEDILVVEDTGIGIAPEDLPRIFENGYTGFNGREDKRASGIGLYLCRRICENLGHEISAESTPGVGTKIKMDLSVKKLEVE